MICLSLPDFGGCDSSELLVEIVCQVDDQNITRYIGEGLGYLQFMDLHPHKLAAYASCLPLHNAE